MRGLCRENSPLAGPLPSSLSPFLVLTSNGSLGSPWPKGHSYLLGRQPRCPEAVIQQTQYACEDTRKWQDMSCSRMELSRGAETTPCLSVPESI